MHRPQTLLWGGAQGAPSQLTDNPADAQSQHQSGLESAQTLLLSTDPALTASEDSRRDSLGMGKVSSPPADAGSHSPPWGHWTSSLHSGGQTIWTTDCITERLPRRSVAGATVWLLTFLSTPTGGRPSWLPQHQAQGLSAPRSSPVGLPHKPSQNSPASKL